MADFEFKAPTTRRPMVRSVVTGVIVLILLGILIWAIVNRFAKQPTEEGQAGLPETSQNDNSADEPSAPTDNNGASDSNDTAQADDESGADSQSGGSADESGTDKENQELADVGPGDTLAIFIGAALLGGLGYELYLRRRAARPQ